MAKASSPPVVVPQSHSIPPRARAGIHGLPTPTRGKTLEFYPGTSVSTALGLLDELGADHISVLGVGKGTTAEIHRAELNEASSSDHSSEWSLGEWIERRVGGA